MTDDPDAPPDRPVRPFRVARFDGFTGGPGPGVADERHRDEPEPDAASAAPPRVAEFDGFGAEPAPAAAVAGFDALDGAATTRSTVAALDALIERASPRRGRPRAADPVGGATPGSTPGAAGSGTGARPVDVEAPDAHAPDEPAPHDGIPPDRPLPRGRRRGGRVGRRGPDAPDPEVPEPEADPVAVAREICLRLLTDRARTRAELARALARKGVPDDAAASVLDRFDEVGLIDDAAFAGQWVRSRHNHRGLGRRAIAVELRRKGVADDVAGEALSEVDGEAEARRARELVDRKLRSLTVDTAEQRAVAARRLVGMLARKGYGAGVAYRVVREALAERGAELDELGAESGD